MIRALVRFAKRGEHGDRATGTDRGHDRDAIRARMAQLGGTLTAKPPPGHGIRHGEHSRRSHHGRPAIDMDRADRSCGLAIRARTAQLGGTLTVESAPGRGTVISVAVPLEPPP